jgi:tRNA dimethylallyltransferase
MIEGNVAHNPSSDAASLLLVLLGPTASGKTALSLHLARHFSGEIVSCDSVAVYREMEIGTAKPSLAERRLVPHHLIDVADISEAFTAGDYSRRARAALADITSRGKLPIVTGGTGLYLRALIDGLFPAPQASKELRERLRRASTKPNWLHRVLTRLDRDAADQIHPNDAPKLIRAIEVSLAAGKPMTQAWQAGRDRLEGYRIIRIGLNPDRQALYERINQRAAAMFDSGLVEETRNLAAKYGETARPLTSLGYRQAIAVLKQEICLPEAIAKAQQGHRNYAKRQMTWFRKEADVQWLEGFGDQQDVREEAERTVQQVVETFTPAR